MTSHVCTSNVDLGSSRVTMNRLISILTNVFDRIIAEIHQYVPLNSWVRVFFDCFPTREFSTSTLQVKSKTVCLWTHCHVICKAMMQSRLNVVIDHVLRGGGGRTYLWSW